MNIHTLFDQASSAMTVVSFLTFLGILWWTFIHHKDQDFQAAAQLPFADEEAEQQAQREQGHV